MSKRLTVTNQVTAKHRILAIEPMTSVDNGEAADASSVVVPGWSPRVEPELVGSSRLDSSRVAAPTLPQVETELVRGTNEHSFASTTDCPHTAESEVINDSNGDPGGVGIEASSPVKPETELPNLSHSLTLIGVLSTPHPEPAAVSVDSLPPTEPETVSTSNPEPAAVSANS